MSAQGVDTPSALRAVGALRQFDAETLRAICDRGGDVNDDVQARTAEIIERVRVDGDNALRELSLQFDGVALSCIEVPKSSCEQALSELDAPLRRALERAARNIASVHLAFMPAAVECSPEPGITIGRRPDPLRRVGVYAPGGRATYPSSLLMGAIPARIAGVAEVIVCSPPDESGFPSKAVMAAAALAQVDRVFAVGGAGAIAAMTFGTGTIPAVDRIVGPGNAYVAEAKIQLAYRVGIDSPAGPSELLVLADDSADPDLIARELVAQAEHDPDAAVIALLIDSSDDRVSLRRDEILACLERRVCETPRRDIVRSALRSRGAIISSTDLKQAIDFSNEWAPEHLMLLLKEREREAALSSLRNAGTIFVGASSSVAFGDYMTGANHVLPTAGAARRYSGLSTLDFVRWTTWQRVSRDAAARMAEDVGVFADAEGLTAHATAARAWGVRQ